MTILRTINLDNGLVLTCHDRSRRYFGDYFQARVVLRVTDASDSGTPADGEPTTSGFVKEFERMGVCEADLHQVTADLIDTFLASALPYLSSPEFPQRLHAWQQTVTRGRQGQGTRLR